MGRGGGKSGKKVIMHLSFLQTVCLIFVRAVPDNCKVESKTVNYSYKPSTAIPRGMPSAHLDEGMPSENLWNREAVIDRDR